MFILSCNGHTSNVYESNQVARAAHELAEGEHAPVAIVQHEKYIGDGVEGDHYISTIFPTARNIH